MPTVSNTSPILNLAIIGELGLLRDQLGAVVIPGAVLQELRPTEDLPGNPQIRQALEEGWMTVRQVPSAPLVSVLQRTLDRGESEAIALAVEMEAELILLDEQEARQVAEELGLKLTGVLGILLRAYSRESPELRQRLGDLEEKAGFYRAMPEQTPGDRAARHLTVFPLPSPPVSC